MSSDSFNIVTAAIARLRSSTHQSIQHLWRYNTCDLSIARVMEAWDHGFNQGWSWAIPNSKGHLSWEQGRQARWFAQSFIIPDQLTGYPLAGLLLRLKLTWWAEQADIFVDGQVVQQGDLFDHTARIVLATAVPGKSIHLAIRLVSPEHDSGALVHSDCLYEFPSHWQGVEP
ncbi:MAG: alpha-mannosidase, partial [Synechococcales cyanobacterium]